MRTRDVYRRGDTYYVIGDQSDTEFENIHHIPQGKGVPVVRVSKTHLTKILVAESFLQGACELVASAYSDCKFSPEWNPDSKPREECAECGV